MARQPGAATDRYVSKASDVVVIKEKTVIERPRCDIRECRFFRGTKQLVEGDESTEVVWCNAFFDGIPDEIAYGNNLHLQPVKGDNGLQYERALT
jgi:hypothetical protein